MDHGTGRPPSAGGRGKTITTGSQVMAGASGRGPIRRPPSAATTTPKANKPPPPPPLLYAQPASVHFGGFALGRTYEQRVRIHNRSAKSVRLQYVLPTKPAFRASFAQPRKAFISPGLDEEVVIAFTPSAFQYYYDCLQVRCEEVAYASNAPSIAVGTCRVPLHAYPVVNDVAFPSRMDFGAVTIGACARRHIDLTCSVPVDFEYELRLIRAHPSFTVFPLTGTIPANGSARIEFEFRPLLYATTSAEVELVVSQLGFEPRRCMLTGSSCSTEGSDGQSVEVTSSSSPMKRPRSAAATKALSSPNSHAQPKHVGSPTASSQRSSTKKQRSAASADQCPKSPVTDKVGGVEVPADLSTMTSVNFILTQQPGKLKPKDLKKAIDANRAMRQRQKEEQAKLAYEPHEDDANGDDQGPLAGDGSGAELPQSAHPAEVTSPAVLTFQVLIRDEASAIDRCSVSRQIREMFFLQELAEIELIEKELEFQSHKIRLGQELLTPEQLEALRQMRELNAQELARRERERQRECFEAKAFDMFTPPAPPLCPYPPRGMLPAHASVDIQPDFKTYKNDLWARRKRVVRRFIRAVSTVIVRQRVQRRLARIRAWLGNSRTRAQVRERVALDWQTQGGGGGHSVAPSHEARGTTVSKSNASIDDGIPQLYLTGFPIVEEREQRRRELIPQSADWDLKFDPFTFLPLREPDQAQLMGHEPIELPPLPTYVPLEDKRELRTGALDECGPQELLQRDPQTSKARTTRLDTRAPSFLELMPRDIFLRPMASFRPLVRITGPRETSVDYVLRPLRVFRTPPRHWAAQLDVGIGTQSLFSLRLGMLRLHERYRPVTDRRLATHALLVADSDCKDTATATSTKETQTHRDQAKEGLYRGVWEATAYDGSPLEDLLLASDAEDVPCLSDSESDEEVEDAETKARRLPTWADAQRLWEEEGETQDDVADDGVDYEPGELLGRADGVPSFERYRHSIRLEREYNAWRHECLEQLPKALYEVAREIHHPDYALVVEGHGPARPLHQPTKRRNAKTTTTEKQS